MTTALSPIVASLLEKAAADNGFDRDLPRENDWLSFASTHCPLRVWLGTFGDAVFLAAFSQQNVAQALAEYGTPMAAPLPKRALSGRTVTSSSALHNCCAAPCSSAERSRTSCFTPSRSRPSRSPRPPRPNAWSCSASAKTYSGSVLDFWEGRCGVTRLAVPELLRASHIKPWADCESDAERLDVYNRLLFAPQLDAAFDKGLIKVARKTAPWSLVDDGRDGPRDPRARSAAARPAARNGARPLLALALRASFRSVTSTRRAKSTMGITKRDLDQAYADHKERYGGRKEDYFALLYLTHEFEKSPEQVARHVAFSDDAAEGINAFHVDVNRRNLYLFQFQWSAQHQTFKEPLRRLAREGMERIFGPSPANPGQLLSELRDRLDEDRAAIDKVLVHFVYNGSPADADQSAPLDALREDLDAKKHLIDRSFEGRNISFTFQFISNEARGPRAGSHTRTTHRYALNLSEAITTTTANGERLHVGFVPVVDLYRMYREMGQRLFERNIRAGLDHRC